MLVLTRKKDEKIMIGEDIEIVILKTKGGQVKLGIVAPEDTLIYREELYKKIYEDNN